MPACRGSATLPAGSWAATDSNGRRAAAGLPANRSLSGSAGRLFAPDEPSMPRRMRRPPVAAGPMSIDHGKGARGYSGTARQRLGGRRVVYHEERRLPFRTRNRRRLQQPRGRGILPCGDAARGAPAPACDAEVAGRRVVHRIVEQGWRYRSSRHRQGLTQLLSDCQVSACGGEDARRARRVDARTVQRLLRGRENEATETGHAAVLAGGQRFRPRVLRGSGRPGRLPAQYRARTFPVGQSGTDQTNPPQSALKHPGHPERDCSWCRRTRRSWSAHDAVRSHCSERRCGREGRDRHVAYSGCRA